MSHLLKQQESGFLPDSSFQVFLWDFPGCLMTVPSAPSVGGLCLFLGGGEGGPWGSGVQCPGLNPQLCISLAAWSWVSQPSVLIVSSPVKWIDYFLSHRIVLKIKCVKNSWHTGNIINCWFLLSLTQHFAAQATASLQTANLPLSSLTSLRLWSVWLVRKLPSFFRTCSFRDSSPRPQWCPLYHTCLLFEAPGLSAQLRWEKVDREDGPASCFQGALKCSCCSAHTRLLHQNCFACSSRGMISAPPESSGPIQHSSSSGTSMLVCVWVQLRSGLRFFPTGLQAPCGLTSILRASVTDKFPKLMW